MPLRSPLVTLLLIIAVVSACHGQEILTNGSFESSLNGWPTNPSYSVSTSTNYNSVSPADGSRYLVLAGAANVGLTYARVVSQSHFAPFTTGVPSDNIMVYLSASTYLHTNDGRNVSYALTLDPGYGQAGGLFHGGAQNTWVTAQTWGYYLAHDPFDSTLPIKPMIVGLELRDSLQSGEYLLLDNVHLSYGGPGLPEPSSLVALCVGIAFLVTRARKREHAR
jgi:hypothetical protein